MKIKKTLEFLEENLQFAENPKSEAEWILCFVLKLKRIDLFLTRRELTASELNEINHILDSRKQRKPLQWILGETEFFGLKLKVRPGVLIPRPETEVLVDLVLKNFDEKPKKIVDIGSGSGAIALAIKKNRPNWTVFATDISEKAIDLTKENAKTLNLDIKTKLGSLTAGLEADIIVSNPPYLPDKDQLPPEVAMEPTESLFSGIDGLDVARQIVDIRADFIALELDPRNIKTLANTLKPNQSWKIEKDLAKRSRFLLITSDYADQVHHEGHHQEN